MDTNVLLEQIGTAVNKVIDEAKTEVALSTDTLTGDLGALLGDVKRAYLGFVVKRKCPHCGAIATVDFKNDYMSYPDMGEQDFTIYCNDGCEEEFDIRIRLTCTATMEFL
jgi:hypothetical protein